jgi:putative membrane protein insertion efficiency factor
MKFIKKFLLLIILGYQKLISPMLGPNCRFYPTCSDYAKESITKLPVHIALWKIIIRICKCHPFHPGGHDPVE